MGDEVAFTFAAVEGDFDVGDDIRVHKNQFPPDAVVAGVEVEPYSFSDFERRQPMLGLLLMFAALVLLTGRWQGLRALAGPAASLAVVVFFIVPAILDGRSATAVAYVGALAIMFATLPLAHGIGPKTIAASLGTTASLALTLGLGYVFIDLAHLSGISSEEAVYLRATQGELSLQRLAARGNGHRRARRSRRSHRLAVIDRDGAPTRQPEPRLPRPLPQRTHRRPRPHRRDRQHSRPRLRRRVPARPAHLQPRRHPVL